MEDAASKQCKVAMLFVDVETEEEKVACKQMKQQVKQTMG